MFSSSINVPVVAACDLEADAHETFAWYRRSFPFIALDTGGYVVLRHGDVARLMHDPRLQATEIAMPAQAGITQGALFDIFAHGMLTANGEAHARRRSAVSRALAGQVSEQFRQHMRRAAQGLIEDCYARGRLELVSGYAEKLPVMALASLLGVGDADLLAFMQYVYAMNAFFRPKPTADQVAAAEAAGSWIRDYLDGLLADAERGRSHGFLARYAEFAGQERLSRLEALVQIVQLIIGGTESVRTALVAQIAHLMTNRDQWRAVCVDPTLVGKAVSEGLRFEPGIAGAIRVSVAEIEIDGLTLPAGQLVLLSSLSALRDETVFDRPNVFDISRPNLELSRLVFGGGAHRCVADVMGRIELEEALLALVERLPWLRIDGLPAFHGHMFVRSVGECWVCWE
ncbi:cytochrome P450 [Martelella endophytica]|nr:cytochrome P450 [Martelella endophytica]